MREPGFRALPHRSMLRSSSGSLPPTRRPTARSWKGRHTGSGMLLGAVGAQHAPDRITLSPSVYAAIPPHAAARNALRLDRSRSQRFQPHVPGLGSGRTAGRRATGGAGAVCRWLARAGEYAGPVPLPLAHAHRPHRGWRELPDEPGPVRAAARARPGSADAVRHRRPAVARYRRLCLHLAVLQRRLPDGNACPVPARYRRPPDGAHQPAAGGCRGRDAGSEHVGADAAGARAGTCLR